MRSDRIRSEIASAKTPAAPVAIVIHAGAGTIRRAVEQRIAEQCLGQAGTVVGADRRFVWAKAVIAGDTVVLSSPQVPQPVAHAAGPHIRVEQVEPEPAPAAPRHQPAPMGR